MIHVPKQTAPQVVCLNGQLIGDTTSDIVCPVSPDGAVYLTAMPLEHGGLPHAMKLQLLQGQLIEAPLGGTCYREDETLHVFWPMDTPVSKRVNKYPHTIARHAFSAFGQRYEATLSDEEQVYLAVEAELSGELALLYQVEDLDSARIETAHVATGEDLLIVGEGPRGARCLLCIPEQGHYRVAFDEYAQGAAENGRLILKYAKQDALQHWESVAYTFEEGAWQAADAVMEDNLPAADQPMDPAMIARAFAEAVLYQKEAEMRWCLAPDWAAELTLADATEFLGTFDHVYAAEKRKEEQIVLQLAAKLFDRAYVLHTFTCTFEQGRMANLETD